MDRSVRSGPWFRFGAAARAFAALLVLAISPSALRAQSLFERLGSIPDFTVVPLPALPGYSESYEIDVRQPVDHDDPSRGTFLQRIYLSHRGADRPTVLYGSGYGISGNAEMELAALLQANQVLWVHRFFPNATPPGSDWRHLTVRQAAADVHRVRALLGGIYEGPWVSAGASKGGMAALFHHRFHPADVDATVAYVAPVMEQPDDPRFAAFLDQVGSLECRRRIVDFQVRVLTERAVLFPLFRQVNQRQGHVFSLVSEEAAYEYAALEYLFAFWQYGREADCATIPPAAADPQQVVDHLLAVSPSAYYADRAFLYFQPLFYQAYTEIGYCPYVYGHLADLLRAVPQPTYRSFAPRDASLVFRPEVMADVVPWLRTQGSRIVYVYGGNDPWTAAALEPAADVDALVVVQPGGNHQVRIADLDRGQDVIDALQRWLGIRIPATGLAAARAASHDVSRVRF